MNASMTTCIQVEKAHRGKGLASVALRGAVDLIAQAGGRVVEGYPVAPSAPGS